ncbi:MAG: 4-alpha-glucanotransferase [Bacteroidia bacterium]|nr:4-alpha-glucanotransferase [Bacteroidia bacterium]
MEFKRSSGILLHPTSLPGKYGIGTLGREAYKFVDFLVESGQKIWQILPLGPTAFGNSPYQCFSSVAGNPLLIDLEELTEEGLLTKTDIEEHDLFKFNDQVVDYDEVRHFKYLLLRKAYNNFTLNSTEALQKKFEIFCNENSHWLKDYSLFMSLKVYFDNASWYEWADDFKFRKKEALNYFEQKLHDETEFQQFIQYKFFDQWLALKEYANSFDIKIIGDIPLYVSYDSADAWVHPDNFLFDKNCSPVQVAGVPPDYFSETGQLWGNPIYNWEMLEKNNFTWWTGRIKANLTLYDIIRIDHFRGLSEYWAILFGEETAVNGKWIAAPGKKLFDTLLKELGDLPIIAEDLGVMTEDVEELRDAFGFPGMKILQFAFDSEEENDYLPHTYIKNCIVYTGTHDNNTIRGWYEGTTEENKKHVKEYLDCDDKNVCSAMIRAAWASVADFAIVPMQDLLELGEDARMNTPGTTGNNWQWRMKKDALTDELAARLKRMTELFWR